MKKKITKKKVVRKKQKNRIINFKELAFVQTEIHKLLNKLGVSIMGAKLILKRMLDDADRRFIETDVIGGYIDIDAIEKVTLEKLLKKSPDLKVRDLIENKTAKIEIKQLKEMMNGKK